MMYFLLALGGIVATSIAANAVVHWPRTRAQQHGNRRIAPRLSLRGWLDECFFSGLAWLGPLLWLLPTPQAQATPTARSLLLLPDPSLPSTAAWLLRRRLQRQGWLVRTARVPRRPRSGTVDQLAAQVNADRGDHLQTLVAVGAAGLVTRQLAARCAGIGRAVTIATPHSGSTCAFLPAHLRPGNDYLQLIKLADPKPREFEAISIYSPGDAWLDPTEAAYYPGAYNMEVTDTGHLSMMFSSRIFGYLQENLAAEMPPRGSSK